MNGVAASYVQEAQALLGRYGQVGDNATALSPSEAMQLDELLLVLQSRMEHELDPILTQAQREQMRSRSPVAIFFRPGNHLHDHTASGVGF